MASPNLILDPGDFFARQPVLNAVKIDAAGLVAIVLATGYATNPAAANAATAVVAGRSDEEADNTAGAAGDKDVLIRTGVFRIPPADGATAPAAGARVYAPDHATVSETPADGPLAGIFRGVDPEGDWIVDTRNNFTEQRLAALEAAVAAL